LIKIGFVLTMSLFLAYADNYTYLVDEYTKEIELEAKIVTTIAKDMIPNDAVRLFIPKGNVLDKKVYSKMTTVVENCEDANFVFVKHNELPACNAKKDKIILTNNYRHLVNDSVYIGAFFWSKSRPNIVLIEDRLADKGIRLSSQYEQFIEKRR